MQPMAETVRSAATVAPASASSAGLMFRVLRLAMPVPSRRPNFIPLMEACFDEKHSPGTPDDVLLSAPLWEGEGVAGGVGCSIVFPSAFGNIFLGEPFKAYVTAVNGSGQNLLLNALRIEITTPSSRSYLMVDQKNQQQEQDQAFRLEAHSGMANHQIEFPLTEVGLHTLTCSATTTVEAAPLETRTHRKNFRFSVQVPLKLSILVERLLFAPAPDKAMPLDDGAPMFLVRVLVTNAMNSLLSGLHVQLKPETSGWFQVVPLAPPDAPSQADEATNEFADCEMHDVLRDTSVGLSADDTYAFTFVAQQMVERLPSNHPTVLIGKLDLSWRGTHGEQAFLCDAGMVYTPLGAGTDIEVTVEEVPPNLRVYEPFELRCRVVNHTNKSHRLYLQVRRDLVGDIVPVGVSGVAIGDLAARSFLETTLTFVALASGSLNLYGIRVVDVDTRVSYNAEAPQIEIA
ncbi:putative trafficking protein particle complex subunit 13-like [Porphyridium purpureum]|uniref:Putative trafficking protein particle complex subunit 13-like n=1 Tax=Porphyridium purpureum TaxID=35688 RepID=A0A5J4YHB6_PORPP|nr:putative trafficking protein particle complex subunit 13-like [Porphyridium purpureum]|eukprot:POR0270..scf251_18